MRKIVLFITALLTLGTAKQAIANDKQIKKEIITKRHPKQVQPIVFLQKGIKFFIYPDGSIDYRVPKKHQNRHWRNIPYPTPGEYRYNNRRNSFITYDYYGRLKRVGNIYINYDRYRRASRIGNVIIRYNRRGLVRQIGGLTIYYNRYNQVRYTEGHIYHNGCGYCNISNCSIDHPPYYRQHSKHQNHYKYQNRKRKKRYDDDDD